MAKKTIRKPRLRGAGKFTEAGFWSMIRFTLRQKSRFWPPIALCRKNARRKHEGSGKKLKYEYQCSICKNWFFIQDIEVDHIIPVGSLNCANDLPGFVERLFVEVDGVQVLCKKCHLEKTKKQN